MPYQAMGGRNGGGLISGLSETLSARALQANRTELPRDAENKKQAAKSHYHVTKLTQHRQAAIVRQPQSRIAFHQHNT